MWRKEIAKTKTAADSFRCVMMVERVACNWPPLYTHAVTFCPDIWLGGLCIVSQTVPTQLLLNHLREQNEMSCWA